MNFAPPQHYVSIDHILERLRYVGAMEDPPKFKATRAGSERAYHHGDLRRALVDAAVRLAEVHGVNAVSMREVAKAVGVSSGAPFRHFPTRMALLTAVAEEAMDRLTLEMAMALGDSASAPPLMRFREIGRAFLRWAVFNPTHFEVISDRSVIDFEGSSLRSRNDAIRETMMELLTQAKKEGSLGGRDPEDVAVTARALAYGLARMYVDGQFSSWGLPMDRPLEAVFTLLDGYLDAVTQ